MSVMGFDEVVDPEESRAVDVAIGLLSAISDVQGVVVMLRRSVAGAPNQSHFSSHRHGHVLTYRGLARIMEEMADIEEAMARQSKSD